MKIDIDYEVLADIDELNKANVVYEDAGDFVKARVAHNLLTFKCREVMLGIIKELRK